MGKMWHAEQLENIIDITPLEVGLDGPTASEYRAQYGPNRFSEEVPTPLWIRLIHQLKDTMIIILILAAVLSGIVGEVIDAVIILMIIIINAILGIIQEDKAEKALKALKAMSAPGAKVIREGVEQVILAEQVVPFDLLVLEAGDVVAADVRLLKTSSLQIQEASLTGESVPVDKDARIRVAESAALGDRFNMAYASSLVTYGRGVGLVIATGMQTEVGKIAGLLSDQVQETTPLQKKLNSLGKTLGYVAIVAVVLLFVVGMWYGQDTLEMFLTATSLAVAVIPESLPAVSTIVLAMGVQRMAKRKAIIRNLSSVETLGSATVICSDKTGTLTQNKMTVVQTWTDGDESLVQELALGAALCNDARFTQQGWIGDPTETALAEWAIRRGVTESVIEAFPRIAEVPFDSARKRMSTVHDHNDQILVFVKGGTDEVLNACTHRMISGAVIDLRETDRQSIRMANAAMGQQALRVLAVAKRELNKPPQDGDFTIESQLTFIGLIGMIDPARPETAAAIVSCQSAGIKVVMITGDHRSTAEAISRDIGLGMDLPGVMTGLELDAMSDEELRHAVLMTGVYARVSPTHKLRIIEAWRSHGQIVAMTGDGVNDAPALKSADIGAAMGVVGTEVAKGAADMVLADDNFATIVAAVEEGRRIKDNILKSIGYLLSCNIGELTTLMVATLFNWSAPLLPIHILWINLVTDSLPALALGVDPAEPGLMNRAPRRSNSLLSVSMIWRLGYQGIMIGGLTLVAFLYGTGTFGGEGSLAMGQTMAFTVLALSQLVHSLNLRSATQSVFPRLHTNPLLLGAIALNALMITAVLFIPPLREIFKLVSLDLHHWEIVGLLVIVPLPLVELLKVVRLNGTIE
jgi:P-type Ca2+ transporter type 2C